MNTSISRPFFFLHIRKTAGVSLRGLLANRFPASKVLIAAHSVSGPQEPGDALFATGHVGFDYVQRFRIAPTTFTVLRNPVSRCLSAYNFFRSHDEQYFRDLSVELGAGDYESRRRFCDRARRLSMRQFLVEEEPLARTWLSNIQTRQLAGASCAGLADEDPRLIATALRHLELFDLVGIVERLDDTLRLLSTLMDWGRLGPLLHLNISARSEAPDVDPACIEILRSWNLLDLRLYHEAVRLFEAKVKKLNTQSQDTHASAVWPVYGEMFTPDQPIYGYGWHEREFHGDKWLCWNSSPVATLDLSLSKVIPSTFRCHISHAINQTALDRLRVRLNSKQLMLQKQEDSGGVRLEGEIPFEAWETDLKLARLTFDCPAMQRPCDIDENSVDHRSLGVALSWLRFL
jgi:hypothetical protein